ncbi:hypothetical protein PGTUg99_015889 [Puccinia graminis f. sp. tritici]|uniref:Uncharacterized protein n=1 Tax=Puccinia graminis f. sp. tritici TaxID=56615 RepID=A0A5B0S572_PUCGR|nr:hypothetical protein PGTUg99_015889 [Puccinia graminis f. sp. tritici]
MSVSVWSCRRKCSILAPRTEDPTRGRKRSRLIGAAEASKLERQDSSTRALQLSNKQTQATRTEQRRRVMSEETARKRSRTESLSPKPTEPNPTTNEESDEEVGPLPMGNDEKGLKKMENTRKKARAAHQHERLYLKNLPSAERYHRSFMHRDVVSWITVTKTLFIITASVDGHIKFWTKKDPKEGPGIEFVKHYRAHLSPIVSVSASVDGMMYASVSAEGEGGSIKIFDVKNFDMINMFKINFVPQACCWLHDIGQAATILAV